MKTLDHIDVLSLACKASQKWGMYISFSWTWSDEEVASHPNELLKAAPYLNYPEHAQLLLGKGGWLLFDDEEEMHDAYEQTVGDDGPTQLNPYHGPVRAYAVTCGPDGVARNENT